MASSPPRDTQGHLWRRVGYGGIVALVALGVDSLAYYYFGVRSAVFVANGIVTSCVLIFILTLIALYDFRSPSSFQAGPAVRTAIAITFSLAYLELLACSLVSSSLGLDLNNPFTNNFFWVYSTIIGFYFGSETAERIKREKPSSGGPAAAP